jgi:uncharacterized protein YlxW (UPF0749 family)
MKMKIKIKKEKVVMSITIGIACLTLMLAMFMQFKVVRETDITEIENMRESELRVELSSWREKYKELNERYEEVSQKVSEYQNEKESDEKTAQLLQTELKQLNEALGKTDVEGEGIEIVLTDKGGTELSDEQVVEMISEEDLLIIVNELFGAGAEAISINDERIIARSDIFKLGDGNNSFLKVNGHRILSPYIIKAIGNQTYLESAVIGKGGHVDALKDAGHEVSLNKVKKVKIDKYPDTISTKYIK